MKTLSIRQPWAWLIARPDLTDPALRLEWCKDVENRTFKTNVRGNILIHAGKQDDPDIAEIRRLFYKEAGLIIPKRLDYGGIVGQVTLYDCIQGSDSEWAIEGMWHWLIRDSKPLPFKPVKGKLGFFEVSYP